MANAVERALLTRGRSRVAAARPERVSTPLLEALHAAGTRHIYADTADVEELRDLLTTQEGAIRWEVDGNTANQPLVRKVVERYLEAGEPRAWAQELGADRPNASRARLLPLLYAIVCGRVGNDIAGPSPPGATGR